MGIVSSESHLPTALEQRRKRFQQLKRPKWTHEGSWHVGFSEVKKIKSVDAKHPWTDGTTSISCSPRAWAHILFRNPLGDDLPHVVCADHLQEDRATRILWVAETLKHPDFVFRAPHGNKSRHVYVSKPAENERFVVIVHPHRSGATLVTAYPVFFNSHDPVQLEYARSHVDDLANKWTQLWPEKEKGSSKKNP